MENKIDGASSTYGGQHSCIQGFGVETCLKDLLGRRKRRRENNIKMDLQ